MRLRHSILLPAALAVALTGCGRDADRGTYGGANRDMDQSTVRQDDVQRSTGAEDSAASPGYGATSGEQAGNVTGDNTRPMTGTADRTTDISSMDRQWATKTAKSNMAELELARLAQQKASSEEVKQYAEHLVTDHTEAGQRLQSIAATKGIDLPNETDEHHKQIARRLQGLSGQEFDRTFISEMVKAHQKDIAHFQKGSNDLRDSELKGFASQTLPKLKTHLEHARQTQGSKGRKG